MSNLWGDDEDDFMDMPEEAQLDENGQPKASPPVHFPRPTRAAKPEPEREYEEEQEEEPEYDIDLDLEENFEEVLNDANLRIEQGRLYQMVMNHPLFEGVDADPRAIANVEKEIRKFARESMEVMLGMRENLPAQSEGFISSPFNDLEVDILKRLASKASNGATERPEANKVAEVLKEAPKRTSLNPIGYTAPKKALPKPAPVPQKVNGKKALPARAAAPIKRSRLDATIERIAAEEGVPRELLEEKGLIGKSVTEMTEQELFEHNKKVSERRRTQVQSSAALPMPTYEQQEMMAMQFASKASAAPGLSKILEKVKGMPGKNQG